MYILENPVLQRELLVNLRMGRSFVLLLLYLGLLGSVVYFAWPTDTRLSLIEPSQEARQLVNLFFLGQYILAALMAPSFASGTISGEKERQTYEMMLASPLKPEAIVLGKLLAALTHLAILVFASLPIVMLCLPLGGESIWEVLAAYLALFASVMTFGMISVACSSFFQRTASALVVSYLIILPLAVVAVVFWAYFAAEGATRLKLTLTVVPGIAAAICISLFYVTAARLLQPPDVGSEGKEVVDIEEEQRHAVGLIIQPNQFPDRLFAPPKRQTLMGDNANPVYDKEIRSEIFSQGTRMLRYVIQISFALAIPLMAIFLYIQQQYAYAYIGYVIIFNVLVGPAFNASSVTSERERATLDLLLTTTITPFQILWGKLLAGLRVSSVLTSFLLWPVLLAAVFVPTYWTNVPALVAFLVVVAITCLTTANIGLACSSVFRKSSVAMMASYIVIVILFCMPMAVVYFATNFFPGSEATRVVENSRIISPFMAAYDIPLHVTMLEDAEKRWRPASANDADFWGYRFEDWAPFASFVVFYLVFNLLLLIFMVLMFNARWRVSSSTEIVAK